MRNFLNYMSKLVSIIIPTRNASKTILHSVKSLLEQNFSNFEIIVVDDNYLLSESNFLRNILVDPRIKIIKSNRNPEDKNCIGNLIFRS